MDAFQRNVARELIILARQHGPNTFSVSAKKGLYAANGTKVESAVHALLPQLPDELRAMPMRVVHFKPRHELLARDVANPFQMCD